MHAHINIWQMSEAGESGSDTVSRSVAEILREQPGFHSYSVVRTGDREVVAITMFETPSQLHAAMDAISAHVQENIHHLAASDPVRRQGDVLFHEHVGE